MLRIVKVMLCMLMMSCTNWNADTGNMTDYGEVIYGEEGDGVGGAEDTGWEYYGSGGGSNLTLPFLSGKYWVLTRGYNTASHREYSFDYGDDSYALDFSRNGCEAYGEAVTPMVDGVVIEVFTEGDGDHGYGNSVLIDHGDGYVSRYAHMAASYVGVGDYVNNNTVIGAVGNTGNVTGSACSEHPGTHLHVAMYHYGEGIKPEPLSGVSPLEVGCWYSREGWTSCSGDPGIYEDEDDNSVDNWGDLDVAFLDISPEQGTAGETEYVWVSIVVSPDSKPDVTLQIYNPNDDHPYDFDMSTESTQSPWVFTYRKSLRDAATYTYWVEASSGDGDDSSSTQSVRVDSASGEAPSINYFSWSPSWGEAGETEFYWQVTYTSYSTPSATLNIVNPSDAVIYEFHMDRSGSSYWYGGDYEKTLRDPTNYTFWVTVENGDTTMTTEIGSVDVE